MDREATIRRAQRLRSDPSATERLLWELRFSNQEIQGSPDLVASRILAALEKLPPVPRL